MKKQKIIMVDPIHPDSIRYLENQGFLVDQKINLSKNELVKIISKYDALIGRTSTKIDKDIIYAASNLKCIGVHATGWDHIDGKAASSRGITLLGFPSNSDTLKEDRMIGSFVPVAEHVILGMLAAAGNFYEACDSMKKGQWEKYKLVGTELHGKTLGIIGLGRIGSLVADRAKAFGMHVIASHPKLTIKEAEERGAQLVSSKQLYKKSDFITVHIPKNNSTIGLIGEKEFSQMKKGVIFINTSRAAIIDESALLSALNTGIIKKAVIDVFNHPPKGVNWKLVKHPQVLPSPHIAGVSQESLKRVSSYITKSLTDFLKNAKTRGIIQPLEN